MFRVLLEILQHRLAEGTDLKMFCFVPAEWNPVEEVVEQRYARNVRCRIHTVAPWGRDPHTASPIWIWLRRLYLAEKVLCIFEMFLECRKNVLRIIADIRILGRIRFLLE